jgi:hypothetical protein
MGFPVDWEIEQLRLSEEFGTAEILEKTDIEHVSSAMWHQLGTAQTWS